MKVLPVAERELRVAARRRGTWWVRFAVAALALSSAALILLAMGRERPTEQAQVLFVSLSTLGLVYALVAGLLTTSDCVSEEKREGTLGLLFLTNLRGYDVIAGKVIASSLRAVSGLVALLPVIGLPLLMGAIGPDTVTCVALTLVNTIFLSLAIGVLVSVLARDSRHAIGGAILAMIGLLAIVPLVRWLLVEYVLIDALHVWERRPGMEEPFQWVFLTNPVMLFVWGVEGLFGVARMAGVRPVFWHALAVQHAMAWAALVLACLLVPRMWRERTGRSAQDNSLAGGLKSAAKPLPGREPCPTPHPFSWIVTRERRAMIYDWVGLALVALGWLWGFIEMREEWFEGVVGLWTFGIAAVWLKLRMAAKACRYLHENRRSGALELVLCTPETPGSILEGNFKGLRDQVLPPLAVTLSAAGLMLVAAVGQPHGDSDAAGTVATFLVVAAVLVLDLWTIARTGTWLGLRSNRYVMAWAMTVGLVLVLPWVAFFTGALILAIAAEAIGVRDSSSFADAVGAWVTVAVVIDVLLLGWSQRGLTRWFRELAAGSDAPEQKPEAPAVRTPTPSAVAGKSVVDNGSTLA